MVHRVSFLVLLLAFALLAVGCGKPTRWHYEVTNLCIAADGSLTYRVRAELTRNDTEFLSHNTQISTLKSFDYDVHFPSILADGAESAPLEASEIVPVPGGGKLLPPADGASWWHGGRDGTPELREKFTLQYDLGPDDIQQVWKAPDGGYRVFGSVKRSPAILYEEPGMAPIDLPFTWYGLKLWLPAQSLVIACEDSRDEVYGIGLLDDTFTIYNYANGSTRTVHLNTAPIKDKVEALAKKAK